MINIITINWNNLTGLKNTIKSLVNQTIDRAKWRFIVVDGLSTDGSIGYLESNREFIDELVIEHDKGIYDAMNKGLQYVPENEYFLFLNSGDMLANKNVLLLLSEIITDEPDCMGFFYGDKINKNGQLIKSFYPQSMKYGIINACHQSILYRKYNDILFDTRYKLFSDLDFSIKYLKSKKDLRYINEPISIYEGGGMSSTHNWKTKKEIYYIVYREFNIFIFARFIFIKVISLLGIRHTSFLKKHK